MEFWITIVGLVRRKRVIIPTVLFAVAFGALAYRTTPISYVSDTTMVLTTTQFGGTESRDPTKPADLTNPMLNFDPSLTTTSAILIEAMATRAVDTQLGATGSTQLIIDDGRTNPSLLGLNGPFLYIVGRSTSPDEAKRVVLEAQALTREKLREWQSALKAPEKTYVSLAEVVPPSDPTAHRASGVKHGLLAFLLAFLTSLGIAYFRDKARTRRRARAAAERAAADLAPGMDSGPGRDVIPLSARSPVRVPVDDEGEDLADSLVPGMRVTAAESVVGSEVREKKDSGVLLPAPVKLKRRSRNP